MFSLARTLLRLPVLQKQIINQGSAFYHALSRPTTIITSLNTQLVSNTQLLLPNTPALMPSCGFKVKGWLRRRCKDCYFVMREKRLFVICKTHPRHKQMSMVPKEKNTWILTHATMGKVRPW